MGNLRDKFGRRLRQLRRQEGMTQEQLAEEAQISVDFVSLLERGVSGASFETLEKLSAALGRSVEELFAFDE